MERHEGGSNERAEEVPTMRVEGCWPPSRGPNKSSSEAEHKTSSERAAGGHSKGSGDSEVLRKQERGVDAC